MRILPLLPVSVECPGSLPPAVSSGLLQLVFSSSGGALYIAIYGCVIKTPNFESGLWSDFGSYSRGLIE